MSSSAPASVRVRLSLPGRGFAEAAVQRARLSVVPRRRTRAPKVPFVTLVSLLMLAGVVGLLLFNTSMQQASFTTTALQERAANLEAREQALRDEIEALRDPQHLGAAATRQGMVPACAPLFLNLGTGQVKGERGTACAPLDIKPVAPERPGFLDPKPIVQYVEATTTATGTGRGTGSTAAAAGTNSQQQSQRNTRQR